MGCGSSAAVPTVDPAQQPESRPQPANEPPKSSVAAEEPKTASAPPPEPEQPPLLVPEPEPEPELHAAPPAPEPEPEPEPEPAHDDTIVVLKEYVPPGAAPKPVSPPESPRSTPAPAPESPRAAPSAEPVAAPASREPALDAMSLSDDEKDEPEVELEAVPPPKPAPAPVAEPPKPAPAEPSVEAPKARVMSQDLFGHLDEITSPPEPKRSPSGTNQSMFPTLAPRHASVGRSQPADDHGFGSSDKDKGLPSIFGGAGKPEPVQLAILALEQKKMREEHEKNMGTLAYMEKLREKNG